MWSEDLRSKLDATAQCMVRLMFGLDCETWVGWGSLVGGSGRVTVPPQPLCEAVDEWLRCHASTFLCRLIMWRSRAHNLVVQDLATEVDGRWTLCNRRRIGRPPRRGEVPLVAFFWRGPVQVAPARPATPQLYARSGAFGATRTSPPLSVRLAAFILSFSHFRALACYSVAVLRVSPVRGGLARGSRVWAWQAAT